MLRRVGGIFDKGYGVVMKVGGGLIALSLGILFYWATIDRYPGAEVEVRFVAWEYPYIRFKVEVKGNNNRICDGYLKRSISVKDGASFEMPIIGFIPSQYRSKGPFQFYSSVEIPSYINMAQLNGDVYLHQDIVYTDCNPLMRFFPYHDVKEPILLPRPVSE